MAIRVMLHLTNGSAIVEKVRAVDPRGRIVPWNDVLHEGPVPAGLGPAALREQRADFLATGGANPRGGVLRDLEARDRALDEAIGGAVDEIVLWLEHDLFDQLHLIQILDRVPVDGGLRITAVQPRTYLGYISSTEYPALFAARQRVSSAQCIAARDAWAAFRSPDPRAIVDVLPRVTSLPHLGAALTRHLEQFPSMRNGLSRTEQETLDAVAAGVSRIREVFVVTQEREEAFFMGDAGFLFHIDSLIRSHRPLLKTREPLQRFTPFDLASLETDVELTTLGESVLSNDSDRVALCAIDRWLGGVYFTGNGPVWRWDAERRAVRFV